ncbi:MAG: hypothetical protein IPH06_11075 [Alphaproteobacteria bacterium]|jgi:hypothetical protein|nr:hypothetical protein [Alphaproteobacteria bacterium]QQS56027.1 MAG: hypothetical protein IPN28_06830 [Alphaproteobacteria bacterium]
MKKIFENWVLPVWHHDFGDPVLEFNLLKNFVSASSQKLPQLDYKLDAFEEGYLCVVVLHNQRKIAELHVTNTEAQELSLFLFDSSGDDLKEMTFRSFDSGIFFLGNFLKDN